MMCLTIDPEDFSKALDRERRRLLKRVREAQAVRDIVRRILLRGHTVPVTGNQVPGAYKGIGEYPWA